MPVVTSLADLRRLRDEARRERQAASGQTQVVVGLGTPAIAAGARQALQAIVEFIEQAGLTGVIVRQTGSAGRDSWEPIVQVLAPAGPEGSEPVTVTYGRVSPEAARRIMQDHVVGGQVVEDYIIPGG
jgi:NADP-reducing hydrogenase subunit HndB